MSSTAEKIASAKRAYAKADRDLKNNKIGPSEAKRRKDAAHNAAEKARAKEGFSGGDDGSKRIKIDRNKKKSRDRSRDRSRDTDDPNKSYETQYIHKGKVYTGAIKNGRTVTANGDPLPAWAYVQTADGVFQNNPGGANPRVGDSLKEIEGNGTEGAQDIIDQITGVGSGQDVQLQNPGQEPMYDDFGPVAQAPQYSDPEFDSYMDQVLGDSNGGSGYEAVSNYNAPNRMDPSKPQLRGGDELANEFGITNDRSEIEDILLDAADQKFKFQETQYGVNEDRFYDNLGNMQNTVMDTLGKNKLNAIQTGASKGMQSANELSAVLGISEQGSVGANQLVADRKILADEGGMDRSNAISGALEKSNTIGSQLANTSANMLNADMVGYGSELNYDSAIENILGNLDAQRMSSESQIESSKIANPTDPLNAMFGGLDGWEQKLAFYKSIGMSDEEALALLGRQSAGGNTGNTGGSSGSGGSGGSGGSDDDGGGLLDKIMGGGKKVIDKVRDISDDGEQKKDLRTKDADSVLKTTDAGVWLLDPATGSKVFYTWDQLPEGKKEEYTNRTAPSEQTTYRDGDNWYVVQYPKDGAPYIINNDGKKITITGDNADNIKAVDPIDPTDTGSIVDEISNTRKIIPDVIEQNPEVSKAFGDTNFNAAFNKYADNPALLDDGPPELKEAFNELVLAIGFGGKLSSKQLTKFKNAVSQINVYIGAPGSGSGGGGGGGW